MKRKVIKKFKFFVWILFMLMFIESIFIKNAEALLVGIMLLMMSFVIFPWEDNLFGRLGVKLNKKNKLFMIFIIFVITCLFMYIDKGLYIYDVFYFIMCISVWLLMIIYKKNKSLQ